LSSDIGNLEVHSQARYSWSCSRLTLHMSLFSHVTDYDVYVYHVYLHGYWSSINHHLIS